MQRAQDGGVVAATFALPGHRALGPAAISIGRARAVAKGWVVSKSITA